MLDLEQMDGKRCAMTKAKAPYHRGNLHEDLMRVARDSIEKDGADKLSLRACARALSVDPAAVYRHFRSKDALLSAVAADAFADLSRRLDEADRSEPDNHREALIKTGLAYVTFAVSNPNRFDMMFNLVSRLPDETIADLSRAGLNAYDVLCRAWSRCAPEDQPPEAAAGFTQAMWSTVHGISVLLNSGIGPVDQAERDAYARSICNMMLDGCLKHARPNGQT
jgi:AcrR family transcriptional regulator